MTTPDVREDERLHCLSQYEILGTPPEQAFDDVAFLAAQLCRVPIALISLLDRDRYWIKARLGLDLTSVPRRLSFCAHIPQSPGVLIVPDAHRDPRFRDNPLVTGPPHIRFYAGISLQTEAGHQLGALSVIDTGPRRLDPEQADALKVLARQALAQMERRRQARALERKHAELQAITDNVPQFIARVDTHRRYVFANRSYYDQLGFPLGWVIGRTMREVLGESAYEILRPYVDRVLSGEAVTFETALIYPSVGRRVKHVSYVPERDGNDRVTGFLLSSMDISERQDAEAALRERTALLDSVLSMTPHHVFWKDRDLVYQGCNANLARAAGFDSPAEVVGKTDFDLGWTRTEAEAFREIDREVLRTGQVVLNAEQSLHRADGTVIVGLTSKTPLRDTQGEIVGVIGAYHDITEIKALEAERAVLLEETERLLGEALERADRDPLTGLLNHRAFQKRLQEEAAHAGRNRTTLGVAVLDLNNFKFFNDAYGHRTGDDVLRLVADTLRRSPTSCHTLSRFGGDEFALLMPGLTVEGAGALASHLQAALERLAYCPPGHDVSIPLNVSLGFAIFPNEAASLREVLDLADARLRLSKSGAGEAVLAADRLRSRLSAHVEGFSMLDALVTAVDNKDRYTRRHSEDVMAHAARIAAALGLDGQARDAVAVAALLHDVGKIGVPDHILRKPGRLTDAEFAAVQQHPQMGAIIVGAVPGFESALDAVRHHHERWDGGGYPFGLRGGEIPPMARLMAVADAYSAMTMDRPYRRGMTDAEARAILEGGAGTQWDPECVQALLQSPAE